LKSIKNKGHFTSRPKHIFVCISPTLEVCNWNLIRCTARVCVTNTTVWLMSVNNEENFNWRPKYFFDYISLPLQVCNWHCIPHTIRAYAANSASLVDIGQEWLHLETKALLCLYLAFDGRVVAGTSYLALPVNGQEVQILVEIDQLLRKVYLDSSVHFCKYVTFLSMYSPEPSNHTRVAHARTVSVWLKSVNNKGHFTWRESVSSAFRPPFDVFSWNFKPHSYYACPTTCVSLLEIGQ
jgi:hypothetical protein